MDKGFFYLVRYFTYLGNMFPQALILFYLLFIDFRSAYYVTGLWGWAYFVNCVIKNYFKRPRPDPSKHKVKVSGYTFPSGHSLVSLVLYFAIIKYFNPDPLMTYTLYSLPFLLGLTRLYLRVHSLVDVVSGWLIGFLYLYFCEDFLNYMHKYFYKYVYYVFHFVESFVRNILQAVGLG